MPVLEESHLGDIGAPILCTSGLDVFIDV